MSGFGSWPRRLAGLLVAMAGTSLAAGQDVSTRLTYQVSTDNTSWGSSMNALPWDTVYVRTLISYIGPGSAAGLGQVIFQPVVSNWHVTDVLLNSRDQPTLEPSVRVNRDFPPYDAGNYPDPGVWGRLLVFKATRPTTSTFLRGHLGTGSAAGLLRTGRADATNWIGEGPTTGAGSSNNWNGGGGVNLSQIANPSRLSTDPEFLAQSQDVNAFGFALRLDEAEEARTLSITTPAAGILRDTRAGSGYGQQISRWYATTTEVSPSLFGGVEVVGAQINVIPGPGVGIVAAGVVALVRRGRR